jgi:hypothetical protein
MQAPPALTVLSPTSSHGGSSVAGSGMMSPQTPAFRGLLSSPHASLASPSGVPSSLHALVSPSSVSSSPPAALASPIGLSNSPRLRVSPLARTAAAAAPTTGLDLSLFRGQDSLMYRDNALGASVALSPGQDKKSARKIPSPDALTARQLALQQQQQQQQQQQPRGGAAHKAKKRHDSPRDFKDPPKLSRLPLEVCSVLTNNTSLIVRLLLAHRSCLSTSACTWTRPRTTSPFRTVCKETSVRAGLL